ncbi:hypothetical protein Tco_0038596 [Tanacetum coccineum]
MEDVFIVGDNCGFNGWFDPPMCPRAAVIIPGLLRNINELREIGDANAIKARRMKVTIVGLMDGLILQCVQGRSGEYSSRDSGGSSDSSTSINWFKSIQYTPTFS